MHIRCGAIRWQIPDFLSDGKSNVGSISLAVYELFIKRIKGQKFDLENEGQG